MSERSSGLIIGVAGRAGAGKTTIADILVKKHGFVGIALADPMKRFCKELFEFSNAQLWGTADDKAREDERYPRAGGGHLTSRYALQTLGTEWGRNCYEGVWVNYCLRTAASILRGRQYDPQYGLATIFSRFFRPSGVVIHDVRFQNEFDAVKAVGGFLIHVTRPTAGLVGKAAEHLSETEQDGFKDFDFKIDNSGTMKELEEKVSQVLSSL